jgi:hypothetical protein
MVRRALMALALLVMAAGAPLAASAQGRPDPAALTAAQREAMGSLGFMDGVWKGRAWIMLPSGEKHTITQTERIGSFLDGAVKVIEGRGYEPDGKVSFNAFGIISYNPDDRTYSLRSYAQGDVGDFVLTPTAGGYVWEIPAGPMTIRYTAVVGAATWNEVGDRVMPGAEPVRFFEMNLTRVGDTDWPAGGWIGPE